MSDNLYSTLLRWNGRNGLAKLHGISVPLSTAPNLGGGPVWYMAYRPEIGEKIIQRTGVDDHPRFMSDDEVTAADAILLAITKDVHEHDPTCGGPDHGDPSIWLRK